MSRSAFEVLRYKQLKSGVLAQWHLTLSQYRCPQGIEFLQASESVLARVVLSVMKEATFDANSNRDLVADLR